ncbi:MAG: RNA polymerase sigma-54 factor [Deltaproteobacteria bacterium RBG_13_60_28]|nr:MAG: RNA polymerase sigma-54 factor [Deltaproteobacteria bacterium RBG_13_60_28]
MALEIRQSLKLTQTLIMTQKLQQAIKLLQLSRLELVGEIHQVLETNPVLEESQLEESQVEEKGELGQEAEVLPFAGDGEPLEGQATDGSEAKSAAEEMNWDAYLQDRLMPSSTSTEFEERETPPFENMNAQKATLKSHLMWQLRMAEMDDEGEAIGTLIIGNLDRDGYLRATIEEIADEMKVSPERVVAVLEVVQGFDPPGVAARDLKECLLLQIKASGQADPLVTAIIENHLQNLGNKNYQAIARDLKVPLEKVFQVVELIFKLDPKPGREFDAEDADYINPDVHVDKVGNDYIISLNEDGLPKLRVNSFYLEALRNPENLPENVKSYIQKHLDNALWFIRSIHQRQKTLYKVTESIIRFQREFLDRGLAHLKPLTLRQVAEDVQMHESTISRVTTNKYIHTPQGVFDLKYFFNSGINQILGDQIASESVKEKIRQIVQGENPENPLSDQEIADILRRDNVIIARRTVAKYRGVLGVLPSSKRKRLGYRRKDLPETTAP